MIKIKCCHCKGNIAAGVEAQKMIVEYVQPDGANKIFGYMMPDGPLSAATGRIVRAWHHKHYHIVRKREARGDAVTGRVLPWTPTGYDTDQDTGQLSEHLDAMRLVAQRIGKSIGDPEVTEAFRAQQHGGAYPHEHHLRLETYQLLAHLHHAHGFIHHPGWNGYAGTPQTIHDELHANAALTATTAARDADPGHIEPPERDWRDQVAVDITELGQT